MGEARSKETYQDLKEALAQYETESKRRTEIPNPPRNEMGQ